MNDLNVLQESPLMESFINGSFNDLERDAKVVPYKIGTQEFQSLYLLADGIYPAYSRFVRSIRQPITEQEQQFAKWQESCRKDIERMFGVMKIKWKFLAHPIEMGDLDKIASRVYTIMVLHNMNVSERVMGDVRTRYDPTNDMSVDTTQPEPSTDELTPAAQALVDANESVSSVPGETVLGAADGIPLEIRQSIAAVAALASRRQRILEIRDSTECFRLTDALKAEVYRMRLTGPKRNNT